MQRTDFLAASAVGIVASLAGATLASAQTVGQAGSNETIRLAYGATAELIDELSADQRDYGGHRVKAIALLNQAKSQLYQGLRARQQMLAGQGISNESIAFADREVPKIITRLQQLQHDYSGHRAEAIRDLEAAEVELGAALAYRGK